MNQSVSGARLCSSDQAQQLSRLQGPNRSGQKNSDLTPAIDELRLVLQAVCAHRCKASPTQPRSVTIMVAMRG